MGYAWGMMGDDGGCMGDGGDQRFAKVEVEIFRLIVGPNAAASVHRLFLDVWKGEIPH